MPNSKELRRRIKSIRSTRQITKAMELVAAAKMRKAQAAALAGRTYASLAWDLIQNVSKKSHPRQHKLLRQPEEIRKVGIVLITSNRGLIGGFNNNIINKALEYAGMDSRFRENDRIVAFVTIGKKGSDAVRKRGFTIAAEFEKTDTLSGAEEFRGVSKLLIQDFVSGKYDNVVLCYMDFISTLRQKPHLRELLPLVLSPDITLGDLGGDDLPTPHSQLLTPITQLPTDFLFEPTPDLVLEKLLPRLTEMQIYQAYLETDAAEHSARMVAMKNASDAAEDLIDELTLEFNQARQAGITKEISEIVSGKLALT